MRRAEQAEAQAVRNVAEAIRRVVDSRGADEAVLWRAVSAVGVSRNTFGQALTVLEIGGYVRRAGGRVYAEKG